MPKIDVKTTVFKAVKPLTALLITNSVLTKRILDSEMRLIRRFLRIKAETYSLPSCRKTWFWTDIFKLKSRHDIVTSGVMSAYEYVYQRPQALTDVPNLLFRLLLTREALFINWRKKSCTMFISFPHYKQGFIKRYTSLEETKARSIFDAFTIPISKGPQFGIECSSWT